MCPRARLSAVVALVVAAGTLPALAADANAKHFITNATGVVPSDSDPRIPAVSRQFEDIRISCVGTSSAVPIWDKLAKAHSMLTPSQPLLALLADFVRVARASCASVDDSTLLSLYVIERNAGQPHQAVINRLITNPGALIRKHGG